MLPALAPTRYIGATPLATDRARAIPRVVEPAPGQRLVVDEVHPIVIERALPRLAEPARRRAD